MQEGIYAASHPVELIRRIEVAYGRDVILSFSKYFYRPQHVLDERTVFSEVASVVTPSWVAGVVSELGPEWELAFNSILVDGRGRKKHIGMIDFVGKPSVDMIRERVRKFLGARFAASLIFFDSGRSVHGYSLNLMAPSEWYQFLGRLLLINVPGELAIIDDRWVGHRLLGGYSALRWSANSSHHSMVPKLLR